MAEDNNENPPAKNSFISDFRFTELYNINHPIKSVQIHQGHIRPHIPYSER